MASDGTMDENMDDEPPTPPPLLMPLLTDNSTAAADASTSKEAALRLMRDDDVVTALRTAMHIQGDRDTLPPSAVRSWLAERFIHSRIAVDQHTAAAVLYESFSQSRVCILRNFPGALPAARSSVAELLARPLADESLVYNYNSHGRRVHYISKTRVADSPETHDALGWWSNVNQLPDTGKLDGLSAGVLWSFISRTRRELAAPR